MSKNIDEREFELVNIIGQEIGANQRDLSRMMDLSLGMTNMLIHRLIAKGYILIHRLDKRKVRYMLTPKGFTEKMRKSVNYTLKTINSIGLIKDRIKEVILQLYQDGERKFFLLGKSDLVSLIEMVFQDGVLEDYTLFRLEELPQSYIEGTLLICTENIQISDVNARNQVDMIEELAKDKSLINAR